MRMIKYAYSISMFPETVWSLEMFFKSTIKQQTDEDKEWYKKVNAHLEAMFNSLLASDTRIKQIPATQGKDPTC